ncbi:MAG: hypothetical protein OXD48_06350 [Litoreibacter sp.]|nr:hypothetical protein [Litoreibacter sp.]
MPYPTKLATCSYCGARTLLKPTARDGHELACGSCGAPLHNLKWLKTETDKSFTGSGKPSKQKKPKKPKHAGVADWSRPSPTRKKPKKRRGLWSKVLDEAWDVVEDIFD